MAIQKVELGTLPDIDLRLQALPQDDITAPTDKGV